MTQENSSHGSEINHKAGRKLIEEITHLIEVVDKIEDNPSQDMIEISRSNTERTSIRVAPSHKSFIEEFRGGESKRSRELTFGLCAEFARLNKESFAEFLSEYMVANMRGNLMQTSEKSDETDTEESTDDSDPDIGESQESSEDEKENPTTPGDNDQPDDSYDEDENNEEPFETGPPPEPDIPSQPDNSGW